MTKEQILEASSVRKLNISDDLKRVAKLIYQSDKYIYPYLFDGDEQTGILVIENMIKTNTIYNLRDIWVIVCDSVIIGMAVIKRIPFKVNRNNMMHSFINCGQAVGQRFEKVFCDYYALMGDGKTDMYVANVCVAESYRGMGVGKKLLCAALDSKKSYCLEVVKANAGAIKLYKELGFEIAFEYPGFIDIPCYSMTKKIN